jgi:hypothetical protein
MVMVLNFNSTVSYSRLFHIELRRVLHAYLHMFSTITLLQKSSALTIHHLDISLENYMVAMHLEAQSPWVMRRSDSGCTTQCFMSLGDVSGYTSALLILLNAPE